MVVGVTDGYEKKLEIVGVGYRVAVQGPDAAGVRSSATATRSLQRPRGHHLRGGEPDQARASQGIDKQLVGEVAANIRKLRKPEPYKGKGVRYAGEQIRRKVGKAGK